MSEKKEELINSPTVTPCGSPRNPLDLEIVSKDNVLPITSPESARQCSHDGEGLDLVKRNTDNEEDIRIYLESLTSYNESLRETPTYDDLHSTIQYTCPQDEESLLTLSYEDVDVFDTFTSFSPRAKESIPVSDADPKETAKLRDFVSPNVDIKRSTATKCDKVCESSFLPESVKIEGKQELQLKRALSQDSDGDTYLHILLSKEEAKYTEQCLLCIPRCIRGKKGLDTINCMGQTALHVSCYTMNIPVTKALLEHGAEPSLLDGEGNSCLHIACDLDAQTLVKCILNSLQNKKDRPAKYIVNLTNSHGLSAIHIASLKENINIVQMLHEHGGNIDQQDDCCGKTPLMFACQTNQLKAVELFIDRLHAEVNIRNMSDYTALHIASQVNNLEIVKVLLKNGAEVGNKTVSLKTEKDLSTNMEVKMLLERYLRKTRRRKSHDIGSSSDSYDAENNIFCG